MRRRKKNTKKNKHKKNWEKKKLNFVFPTGSENFSPAGRSRRDEMVKSDPMFYCK